MCKNVNLAQNYTNFFKAIKLKQLGVHYDQAYISHKYEYIKNNISLGW